MQKLSLYTQKMPYRKGAPFTVLSIAKLLSEGIILIYMLASMKFSYDYSHLIFLFSEVPVHNLCPFSNGVLLFSCRFYKCALYVYLCVCMFV